MSGDVYRVSENIAARENAAGAALQKMRLVLVMMRPKEPAYLVVHPGTDPWLARFVLGRAFDDINEVERFIREDCTAIRARQRYEATQQAAAKIAADAPGVLKVELPTNTVTDVVCPDGTTITIKTCGPGNGPVVELPGGVHTRPARPADRPLYGLRDGTFFTDDGATS
jgi:hypothetical protein